MGSSNIWEKQYKLAKNYNKNLKKDLDKDDVDFRKDPEQYVF